ESAPDRGTTFAVLLPASDASEEEAPLARTADVSHGTILVADDQPAVLDVVVRTLEAAGWRVFSASDGREAVDVFEAHQGDIDAVFLDVDMPRLDGVGALKRLRALAPDLPIVIASGKGVPAGLGTAQFLSKPFDHRRLHEALAKACA
ncbi:MAG: response regulator, partial [Sandaracinaceae bacterium]